MTLLNVLILAPAQQGMGSYSGIIMMVLIVAVFYFFMIRPQTKRQKEIAKAREAMKPGDKIVTSGGMHGKIKEVADAYFIIEIAQGVNIKVDKASVFASAADSAQAK